jgi:integrase/recombinase XerD
MYTLEMASKDFIHHCVYEKNLSIKTIKSYSTDLKQLSNFLQENSKSLEMVNITKIELRDYIELISTLKPKSRKRKIATIKAMLNYLEYEDKIIVNPIRKMRIAIKEPVRIPCFLTLQEIKSIFKVAYDEIFTKNKSDLSYRISMRNIAVIELLFATGARVSEIANLKDDDIDLDSGVINIKGKGNKERIIQISNKDTIKILINYRRLYNDNIDKFENYYFVNRLKRKLSDQSIRIIIKNLSKKANIRKHVTPHTFRHSFATLLLEKEVDIKYIQTLLGHSSITTTQIYTHASTAKIMEILKIKHPREDFTFVLNEG